jgi:ubiquinone/menaquinone biosynthesis C-methylase UbiE
MFVENPWVFERVMIGKREQGRKMSRYISNLLRKHGVMPGGRILDLGCGIGRIAVPLAEYGYRVTCVDISPRYIELAGKYAVEKGVSHLVETVVGDAWEVDRLFPGNHFDAVLMVWTTILGYRLEKNMDIILLRKLHTITKPNGILAILSTVSRDLIVSSMDSHGNLRPVWNDLGNVIVLEEPKYDPYTSTLENTWTYLRREKGDRFTLEGKQSFTIRVYTLHELIEIAKTAGWEHEASYHSLETMKPHIPGASPINSVFKKRM